MTKVIVLLIVVAPVTNYPACDLSHFYFIKFIYTSAILFFFFIHRDPCHGVYKFDILGTLRHWLPFTSTLNHLDPTANNMQKRPFLRHP